MASLVPKSILLTSLVRRKPRLSSRLPGVRLSLEVFDVYGKVDGASLEIVADLTSGTSGEHCEPRTEYPWGPKSAASPSTGRDAAGKLRAFGLLPGVQGLRSQLDESTRPRARAGISPARPHGGIRRRLFSQEEVPEQVDGV